MRSRVAKLHDQLVELDYLKRAFDAPGRDMIMLAAMNAKAEDHALRLAVANAIKELGMRARIHECTGVECSGCVMDPIAANLRAALKA